MELHGRVWIWILLLTVALVLGVHGDLCEVNVCSNGGTCVTGSGSEHICICPDGFTGDNCTERETGPCSPNPCLNEGQCEVASQSQRGDVFSTYLCNCPPETTGVHCETSLPGSHPSSAQDVNECQDQPCLNGGTCRDLNGDFKCHCPSPYVGKRCQLRCISRLGLEGGGISEAHIRASSVRYTLMGLQRWGPELARLNLKGLVNAWSPAPHDRNPSIQVDLQRIMRVSGLVTQGAGRLGSSEFIKAFKVAFSLNGTSFSFYRRGDKDVMFPGNMDKDSPKTTLLDPPIVAQFVRIVPVVCRRACTLRLELVGCELNGCSEPMGMKSRLIPDSRVSASSSFRTWSLESFTWRPQFARLDKQGKTNAWTAQVQDRNQWIQVDLGSSKKLTGIITQGAKDFGQVQFVSAFRVSYSQDGQNWTTVKDRSGAIKIFPGNSDNNVHKKNRFEPPLFCRFVRVLPWDWHERITLRLELLGCSE